MEAKLETLKEETSQKKKKYETAKIRLEEAFKGLEKDFGLKNEKEAESKMVELSKKSDKLKVKRDKLINRAEMKLRKYDESTES